MNIYIYLNIYIYIHMYIIYVYIYTHYSPSRIKLHLEKRDKSLPKAKRNGRTRLASPVHISARCSGVCFEFK